MQARISDSSRAGMLKEKKKKEGNKRERIQLLESGHQGEDLGPMGNLTLGEGGLAKRTTALINENDEP